MRPETVVARVAWKAVVAVLIIIALGVAAGAQSLEQRYWGELDTWVKANAARTSRQLPPTGIQQMAETCGKLVMVRASAVEQLRMTTTAEGRDDFDFKVDVCVKLTAQRITPQPEFEDPAIKKSICIDTRQRLFKDLCRRANLIP